MKKTRFYSALILLPAIAFLSNCSSNKAKVAPTPSAGGASVSIQNFAFVPDTVTIKVGQSITWTNKDSAPHTATELNSGFDSGTINASGGTFTRTFGAAGTFTYHCLVHPMMKNAVVIVTN